MEGGRPNVKFTSKFSASGKMPQYLGMCGLLRIRNYEIGKKKEENAKGETRKERGEE